MVLTVVALVGCVVAEPEPSIPTPDISATVEAAVQAAFPTPTPTPTPNIEATIQVRLNVGQWS